MTPLLIWWGHRPVLNIKKCFGLMVCLMASCGGGGDGGTPDKCGCLIGTTVRLGAPGWPLEGEALKSCETKERLNSDGSLAYYYCDCLTVANRVWGDMPSTCP